MQIGFPRAMSAGTEGVVEASVWRVVDCSSGIVHNERQACLPVEMLPTHLAHGTDLRFLVFRCSGAAGVCACHLCRTSREGKNQIDRWQHMNPCQTVCVYTNTFIYTVLIVICPAHGYLIHARTRLNTPCLPLLHPYPIPGINFSSCRLKPYNWPFGTFRHGI